MVRDIIKYAFDGMGWEGQHIKFIPQTQDNILSSYPKPSQLFCSVCWVFFEGISQTGM